MMENLRKLSLKDFINQTRVESKNPAGGRVFTLDKVFINNEDSTLFYGFDEIKTTPTDFAILNGVMLEDFDPDNPNEKRGCVHWLRDFERNIQGENVIKVAHWVNGFCSNGVVNNYVGIKPRINVDLKKFLNYKDKFILTNNSDEPTRLLFGEFPQSYVGKTDNDRFEDMFNNYSVESLKTGKKYFCRFDRQDNPVFAEEYLIEQKKYVRLFSNAEDPDHTAFNDGTIVGCEDGTPKWVKVEPIKWNILNWSALPKEINPLGDETAEDIALICENAINCMPFYVGDYYDKNNFLWQNSTIRGYLNGINVNNIKSNGDINYTSVAGGNFEQGASFLNEAFENVVLKVNDLSQGENMKKPNPYNFNFSELSNDELLNYYVQTNSAVFLHGPSGVGKSARVKEIDSTATRITLRPQMNPEEIDGTLDRQTGKYIPPLWWTDLCEKCENEPDRTHVLFIDELTNVKPTVQSLIYSIVLDRAGKDGLWPLPKNCVVIAAGNENADNLAAYPLTNALFRRFCHIYYEVSKEDWLCWATGVSAEIKKPLKAFKRFDKQSKIHPAIVAYIMSRGENVLNQSLDEENPKIVTDPRKWEIASNILYATNNPYALTPAIGENLTTDFIDFVQTIMLDVSQVVNQSYDKEFVLNMDLSSKIANIIPLTFAQENDLPKVRGFVKTYFGEELLANFDLMWIKNDSEKAMIISESEIDDEAFRTEKEQTEQKLHSEIAEKNLEPLPEKIDETEKPKISENFEPVQSKDLVVEKIDKPKIDNKEKNRIQKRTPFSWLLGKQKSKYALTVDEFFEAYKNNHEECAIKCKSEEEAKLLCKIFNIIGEKQVTGMEYDADNTNYTSHTNCFGNDGNLGSEMSYSAYIDFDKVDFTKYVSKKVIEKAIKKGEKTNGKDLELNA